MKCIFPIRNAKFIVGPTLTEVLVKNCDSDRNEHMQSSERNT